jgi:hypothetical protein
MEVVHHHLISSVPCKDVKTESWSVNNPTNFWFTEEEINGFEICTTVLHPRNKQKKLIVIVKFSPFVLATILKRKRAIKVNRVIIKEYYSNQLHTKFYPTFFSQG